MRAMMRTALLSAVVAALTFPAIPALADTAPLPETVLRLKSIEWQPRTGNVHVTAKVKCTGEGTFRWAAAVEQNSIRARNTTNVPCDDDGYLSTLVLAPKGGRFHPGKAEFTLEQYVSNDEVGIGSATLEMIRISPR